METTIRCTSYLLKSFEPKWNNKGGGEREGEKSRNFGVLHKATLLFVRLFTLVFFWAPQKGGGNNTGWEREGTIYIRMCVLLLSFRYIFHKSSPLLLRIEIGNLKTRAAQQSPAPFHDVLLGNFVPCCTIYYITCVCIAVPTSLLRWALASYTSSPTVWGQRIVNIRSMAAILFGMREREKKAKWMARRREKLSARRHTEKADGNHGRTSVLCSRV
jgi:hypothetical protein